MVILYTCNLTSAVFAIFPLGLKIHFVNLPDYILKCICYNAFQTIECVQPKEVGLIPNSNLIEMTSYTHREDMKRLVIYGMCSLEAAKQTS